MVVGLTEEGTAMSESLKEDVKEEWRQLCTQMPGKLSGSRDSRYTVYAKDNTYSVIFVVTSSISSVIG